MGGSNCKSFSPKSSGKIKSSLKTGENTMSSKLNEDNDVGEGKSQRDLYVENIVCLLSDIGENEMKEYPFGSEGEKILLVKQNGQVYALGTKCTHYGAPLHTGALGEGRIRCPWHGACFNIKNGDIEDFPGLDSLPSYEVTVHGEQVKVKALRSDLTNNKRTKKMCKLDGENTETAVIVGGGPSGATCVETLRQEGFKGRIVMICKEEVLPYDRVKFSKSFDTDVTKVLLRSQCFYKTNNIETMLGIEATNLETEKQIVHLSNSETLHYDHLYIATGSSAKKSDIPGDDLENIFLLRNYTDAEAINKALGPEKRVVVYGSGFIGMEAAATCFANSCKVTIVSRSSVPFIQVFGKEIGNKIKKDFEDKGIVFKANSCVCKFLPNEDNPKAVGCVEFSDNTKVAADVVILGIGSSFNTTWLKDSGIKLLDDGSVEVNEYLRTSVENVYAGGDIAYAPVSFAGVSATIGHFGLAHYHGKVAAMNICKKITPLNTVPFFWTSLLGKNYRYAGYGKSMKVKIEGSLEDSKFFAYHSTDDNIKAMSSLGRDPIVSDFANLLYEGQTLSQKEVTKNPTEWMRNKPRDLQISKPATIPESKS